MFVAHQVVLGINLLDADDTFEEPCATVGETPLQDLDDDFVVPLDRRLRFGGHRPIIRYHRLENLSFAVVSGDPEGLRPFLVGRAPGNR